MKKVISLVLCLLLAVGFAGCSRRTEVALVTGFTGIDDGSFNQGIWQGILDWQQNTNGTCAHYKPVVNTREGYLQAIDEAVSKGASLVVLCGQPFAEVLPEVQEAHPKVYFALMDAVPEDEEGMRWNTMGISFAEQQAGYLAGYAAVWDGYTRLGFMGGMNLPPVANYGLGFVQGANDAAAELNVDIEMNYTYTGTFDPSPAVQALAAEWYQSGTEVIFACGGNLGIGVMTAAEANSGKTIGVDVDQSAMSNTVITSAMKELAKATRMVVEMYANKSFHEGKTLKLDAGDQAVGLPMETSRFHRFSQQEYDALYAKVVAAEVVIPTAQDVNDGSPLDIVPLLAATTLNYLF